MREGSCLLNDRPQGRIDNAPRSKIQEVKSDKMRVNAKPLVVCCIGLIAIIPNKVHPREP